MKTGMLWFDDDPKRPLEEKLERAAQHYRQKYGVTPDLCYANPATVAGQKADMQVELPQARAGKSTASLTLKTALNVLPNHFWLGVTER